MSIYHLELDGITIEIQRKPVKNITLRIYPNGEVRVSAPLRASKKQINNQIELKRDWIKKRYEQIQARPTTQKPNILTGECHLFLGEPYILDVEEKNAKPYVNIENNILTMRVRPNMSELDKSNLLETWYRYQMGTLLPDLIDKWEKIIGVNVKQWGIKVMKTRWGSCNVQAHRIWLNLELIKKPLICLESVIVHEMVHLLEASHNARFYALMDQFMPTWRVANQSLKSI